MPRVLAIAAHPDDIEFLMAGTLLHLVNARCEVHYWNLADGRCGAVETDGDTTAAIRLEEARAAAKALGAVFHPPICRDLEIFYDHATLTRVAAVIRQVAPEILLTHSPSDYMEDHTETCRLAVTAAFTRGMPNYPAEPPVPAIENPVAVYHSQPYFHRDPLGQSVLPQFFVDVTNVIDQKCELLRRHASQKNWLDRSQGQDSYLDTLRELDAQCGQMSAKFRYAEGWRRHWHIGFGPAGWDPLSATLSPELLSHPQSSFGARNDNDL